MDHSALKSALAALLLLSATSISIQQSVPPGANSSSPVLKSSNQTAGSGDPGTIASSGVPASPPPPSGGPSLPATPPPSPPAGNLSRDPPPHSPDKSSGSAPGQPALGSLPPPPPRIPMELPGGDGREKGGGGGIPASDEEVRRCKEKSAKCGNNLVFCLLDFPKAELEKQHLVVHNEGKDSLVVSVVNSTSTKTVASVTLRSNESKKVELAAGSALNYSLLLDDEKSRCPLSAAVPPPPSPPLGMLQQLPAYASRLSPVYATYAMLFTALLAGCSCAWCRFRRRPRHVDAGIPYRQLEMGTQTQPSYVADTSTTVVAAQGWDQGWDDDWDDEESATGPPHGGMPAAASSNGAAKSKSSAKDGWEDWDD